MRVFMFCAVAAMMPELMVSNGIVEKVNRQGVPPMNPLIDAPITNHRLPNLSEVRPKTMIETAEAVVHIMANKLEFALGPVSFCEQCCQKQQIIQAYRCPH